MARIPNDHLERIKSEISLLRLVESQGHQVVKQGKDYAVCCPFRDDKTPSCIISTKTNLFNCFGCGAGGSVIDWVMKTEGVSFRHAVELLRAEHFPALAADKPVKKATIPKLESPLDGDADDHTVLAQAIDFYHDTLLKSPDALGYLKTRGLDDDALVKHFKLGYANRTLGLRLPDKYRKDGAAIREQLKRIGLYRDTGREHFNGSLVIPVINEQGQVTEVYGRKLLNNLRKGTPKHTYLPGPHEGVFNIAGLKNTDEIILCESLIDALTFWRWGFKHVTTSYGINGFTEEILQALIDHKIQRVLIAYDRDEAGERGAKGVAEQCQKHGIDCFRILFPKNMDANEYTQKMSPPQKSLGLVIRKAEWLGVGKPPERQLDIATQEPSFNEGNMTSSLAADTAPEQAECQAVVEKTVIDENATPVPALPLSGVEVEIKGHDLFIGVGDRIYRVRGFDKNTEMDQLKIQLMVRCDEAMHMDKLDLYSSKQRQVFINQASAELSVNYDVIKKDLSKVLLALETQQAQQEQEDKAITLPNELSPEEKEQALALLNDPDLLNRILTDFSRAGVVGEDINKLVGYLACVSRKLDKPLAVMIQSSSAAGKSSLMDSVLALMPEEERIQYSAMTGQSLFYMGETNLKNKILAISEEEGASNASYALKLLQSEGEITMASTGKDDNSGTLVTREYKVEGPVMLLMTTTAIDIDEELMNRCLVLSVNESREQTQAIHRAQRQRRTLEGLEAKVQKDQLIQLHQNAQRLLKPLAVINPYADQLTFLDDKTRTRRDHEKYLTLIDSIALLHQYQREIKSLEINGRVVHYIEATLEDIDIANRLAHDVLGRTLDELPPQTRKLLKAIQAMVASACKAQGIAQGDFRFSRKMVRDYSQWGNTQLKVHIKRLEEMEYLLVHRGGRGQSFDYELLYDAREASDAHLMGLIDVELLKKQASATVPDAALPPASMQSCDTKKSGLNNAKSGSSRPQVGGVSGCEKSPQLNGHKVYEKSGSVYPESVLPAV